MPKVSPNSENNAHLTLLNVAIEEWLVIFDSQSISQNVDRLIVNLCTELECEQKLQKVNQQVQSISLVCSSFNYIRSRKKEQAHFKLQASKNAAFVAVIL